MKRKLLFKLVILTFGAFLWMSHSGGRAADKNQGSTGAPGDGTSCSASSCHGSTAIVVDLSIAVTDANSDPVTEYVGGETYSVRVTVNHSGGATPAAFGFQLVALTDSDDESTESFANPASNVQIATASTTGRMYAEHNGPSSGNNSFTVDWTAPASGAGTVTFYAAGNGVNNDGGTSGDGGNEASFSMDELTSSNVNEIAEKWELNLFPNPVAENINLKGNSSFDGTFTVTIVDVAGRAVASQQVASESGQMSIPSASLLTGNYTLMLQNEEGTAVVKFVKL